MAVLVLMGYAPVSDRILKIQLHAKPYNISMVQCYASTNETSDEDLEDFYSELQDTLDKILNREIKINGRYECKSINTRQKIRIFWKIAITF